MEWQPIETAPKDNTEVLLGRPDGLFMIGFYRDGAWDDGDYRDHETWPTHWMPLPTPPQLVENTTETAKPSV